MRRVLLLLLLIIPAGPRDVDAQVLGYAIAGPAGFSGFFGSSSAGGHGAVGAQALVRGWAGLAGEFGVLGDSGGGLIVSSVNGVLYVLPSRRDRGRPSPFVTGGYTRLSSGEGTFKAWNAGAGVDLWPTSRAGLRMEFRDHVRPDSRGTVHYWSIRAGMVVR